MSEFPRSPSPGQAEDLQEAYWAWRAGSTFPAHPPRACPQCRASVVLNHINLRHEAILVCANKELLPRILFPSQATKVPFEILNNGTKPKGLLNQGAKLLFILIKTGPRSKFKVLFNQTAESLEMLKRDFRSSFKAHLKPPAKVLIKMLEMACRSKLRILPNQAAKLAIEMAKTGPRSKFKVLFNQAAKVPLETFKMGLWSRFQARLNQVLRATPKMLKIDSKNKFKALPDPVVDFPLKMLIVTPRTKFKALLNPN
eukprot:maker-scaffold14_size734282-snap-gene-3.20 protein:Tk11301 transcript:maker-scaffold14_size734282-snap-gene-3.20-mRNA-1 annotation:"tpa_inf: hirudin-like protein"